MKKKDEQKLKEKIKYHKERENMHSKMRQENHAEAIRLTEENIMLREQLLEIKKFLDDLIEGDEVLGHIEKIVTRALKPNEEHIIYTTEHRKYIINAKDRESAIEILETADLTPKDSNIKCEIGEFNTEE